MLIALVVFFAAFMQSLLGFGGALIAMPLLATLVGIHTATPAFAIVGTLATLLNAIRWRSHTSRPDLIRLIVPAVLGIPLGIGILARVDSAVVTHGLGVLLLIYVGYHLLGFVLPPLQHPAWAYATGFSSGVLSGAFNTGGPPVIVFASTRQWSPDQFRGNLQTYFLIISLFLVTGHWLSGNLTGHVWHTALIGIPALVAGQFAGSRLCGRVKPDVFRRLALVLLLLLGLQLLFS